MERETLTEWPKDGEPVPEGLWEYKRGDPTLRGTRGASGFFRMADHGRHLVFALDVGGLVFPSHFYDGETFEPIADARDARLSALEAENAGLRSRVADLEASIEREAAYRREQQERQDRLAGVP